VRITSVALAAGLLVCAASPIAGQALIRTDVDTTRVTVGDRITMTVVVEAGPGARIEWPDSLDLGPFEVLEARIAPSVATGEGVSSLGVFTLAAFELGELEIPALAVEVAGGNGVVASLTTDPFGVEVVSVGADETGDVRDIRGPLEMPIGAMRIVLGVLLLLVVSALLYAVARRLWARGDQPARPTPGPLMRPAHELAFEALAALEGSSLLERGQVKEYHIEASDILRTYVERHFRVTALEMTTHEVLAALQHAGIEEPFTRGLSEFLKRCDRVKFAKMRPGTAACRRLLDDARALVHASASRPIPKEIVSLDRPIQDGEQVPAYVQAAS
jgi:hypothetical protein